MSTTDFDLVIDNRFCQCNNVLNVLKCQGEFILMHTLVRDEAHIKLAFAFLLLSAFDASMPLVRSRIKTC